VVELALEPVELAVSQAEAREEGDVLHVGTSESSHRPMILNGMAFPAPLPRLRPMLPSDVDAATELILGNEWGVRREWLEFATSHSECLPLVAEADGAIVATGVGTANGTVGWIGTIFIAPERRGRGLGRALTQEIIDRLERAGCRSLVLVATSEGRRLYERMGFEVQTRYQILQVKGLPPAEGTEVADATHPAAGAGAADAVRPFEAGDLPAIERLDQDGTGEDRAHAIRRLAAPDTTRVATGDDGSIEGYVVRAPWGGGATIARTPEAALRILTARRRAAGEEGRVSLGVLAENADGLARLVDAGMRPSWSAPRMHRGAPLTWRPEWIWGQFNHAMG
jgi:GNAT superfamily N-acetyltransferase